MMPPKKPLNRDRRTREYLMPDTVLKVFSFLFSFLLICSLRINRSNARSIGFSGEWLTISQLAQKHPDWLDFLYAVKMLVEWGG